MGGDPQRKYQRCFPNASAYLVTDWERETEQRLDVTDLPLPDNSQDAYLRIGCWSTYPTPAGRWPRCTERFGRGAVCLWWVPFMFPIHDTFDYWRPSQDGLVGLFTDFEIDQLVHQEACFPRFCNFLQRPVRKSDSSRLGVGKALASLARCWVGSTKLDESSLGFRTLATKR